MSLKRLTASSSFNEIFSIFESDGALIVKNLVQKDVIKSICVAIKQKAQNITPGSVTQGLDENAKEFLGRKTIRFSSLGRLSPAYFNVIDNFILKAIADKFLKPHCGTYWINTGQAMLIGPGEKEQIRHRDCFNWALFCLPTWPNCHEITISSMIALEKITEKLGATRVIPGSHLWQDRENLGLDSETVAAEMDPGDALIYSGKIVHGAGANQTRNKWRMAMHLSFVAGWLVPEEASVFDYTLEEIKRLSPHAQQLLGFRSFDPRPNSGGGLWLKDVDKLEYAFGLERKK